MTIPTGKKKNAMRIKIARFSIYVLSICLLISCMSKTMEVPTDIAPDEHEKEIQPVNHLLILSTQGDIKYKRNGWENAQSIYAGTLISPMDLIYPQGDKIYILFLCPDGQVKELLTSDFLSSDVLSCKQQSSIYIFGESGSKRLIIQRGGNQNPTVPYLIYPRATIIKDTHFSIEWNLVANASYYVVTVIGNKEPTISEPLLPADFVDQNTGKWETSIGLEQGIPYTVEICVYYFNMQKLCTTDPSWSTENTAFFYDPASILTDLETQITSNFTKRETPEELYAKAYSFGQPIFTSPYGQIGLYGDSIKLINEIIRRSPDSQLAKSPVLFNYLGELYLSVGLPVSANKSFQRAYELSHPGQESFAIATLGLANTSSSQNNIDLYQQALNEFEVFQNDAVSREQLHQVCIDLGSVCLTLTQCKNHQYECVNWSKETEK